jgi:hypothetical protein
MAIALVGLALPQRSLARPAQELGESFHADQYPSRRAAIADLAKQVADELKSRTTTPTQIDVFGSDCLDDELQQRLTIALKRELPEIRVAMSAEEKPADAEPATRPSGLVARVKLVAGDTTNIAAPWSSDEDQELLAGSYSAYVGVSGAPAMFTSRFADKPWADDWAGFINANSSHRWLIATSSSPGTSESEATDSARLAVADQLTRLVVDQMRARAGRRFGPKITVKQEWVRNQVISSLQRNVDDKLVRDVFVQRFSRPYADVWQASILVDASPKSIDRLVDSYTTLARVGEADTKRSVFAVGGIVAVIVLMYLLLNTITKGYFMWRLRAAALLMAIAAVLFVFARIGYS